MELQGERTIPASIDTTWAALNDPEVLKACIKGCESIERGDDDTMNAVVAMKIGPVSARFKGRLELTNVDAPNGYTINFDGQGGMAGFGKGSADVTLTAQGPSETLLAYTARATIGGKVAQIGSRLVDAAAGKITQDFFKAFEAHLQAGATPADEAAGDGPGAITTTTTTTMSMVEVPTVPSGAQTTKSPAEAHDSMGVAKLWWLMGAALVLAATYVAMR